MPASAVIPTLDELEVTLRASCDELAFERGKQALGHRVVEAVAGRPRPGQANVDRVTAGPPSVTGSARRSPKASLKHAPNPFDKHVP